MTFARRKAYRLRIRVTTELSQWAADHRALAQVINLYLMATTMVNRVLAAITRIEHVCSDFQRIHARRGFMATGKQSAAARRNIKKAANAARRKRTIAHLPKSTRTALGKQAAKVARQKRSKS